MTEETVLAEERKDPTEMQMDKPFSSPRRSPGITSAVILIGLGVALLLDNLGVVSIAWLEVIRFWPVLLILGGIDLLFGSRSIWGSIVAGIIAIVAIGAILFFSWSSGPGLTGNVAGTAVSGDINESLGGANSLEVTLDIGAAQTSIGVLNGSSDAVQGTYETDSRFDISSYYQMRGDIGVFTITQTGENIGFPDPAPYVGKLDLSLPEDVPTSIDVNAGVGEMTLDLSGLTLTSLAIDAGVGSTTITLPSTGGYSVNLSAGVGTVDITLPAGVEARVNFDGGLSGLDADSRFEKIGDGIWQTAGYSASDNRVEINIDSGLGSVTIRQ
jgi:hypothetical protein